MKIPSTIMTRRGISSSLYAATTAVMVLSNLQGRNPIVFEQSFQTLTSSSLSWIDKEFDNELLSEQLVRMNTTNTTTITDTQVVDVIEEVSDNNNHEEQEQEQEEQLKQQRNIIIAKVLIRRIVYKCLDKYSTISSTLDVDDALKYHTLPKDLQVELFSKYGGGGGGGTASSSRPKTWYDAINQLQNHCRRICHDDDNNDSSNDSNYYKAILWEHILNHPITAYVPVQCQSCGHIIPDEYNNNNNNNNNNDPSNYSANTTTDDADADIGLTEVEPTSEEQPFVRTGWFRGPRIKPKVFVLDCPKCKHVSRWYRKLSFYRYAYCTTIRLGSYME